MDAPQTTRALVRVTGRVQGVWFRDSTRLEAESRGVAGWVRNLPDGSVEACFEGAPAAVAALVAYCRTGPPKASVEGVAVTPGVPEGLRGFAVLDD